MKQYVVYITLKSTGSRHNQVPHFILPLFTHSLIEANSFKNRIDKYWNYFVFKYNWKAEPTGPEAVVKVF